jgi:hypothetical protein
LGIAITDVGHYSVNIPAVSYISIPEIPNDSIVLAWKKDNRNPMLPEFIDIVKNILSDPSLLKENT